MIRGTDTLYFTEVHCSNPEGFSYQIHRWVRIRIERLPARRHEVRTDTNLLSGIRTKHSIARSPHVIYRGGALRNNLDAWNKSECLRSQLEEGQKIRGAERRSYNC